MESESTVNPTQEKRRGFWLTAFLILMFISNPFAAIAYFANPEPIMSVYPKATEGILFILGIMCVLNVVLAALIWNWKRIGVYAFYVVIVLAFAINVYLELDIITTSTGMIGGVIIYLTTNSRWHHFN